MGVAPKCHFLDLHLPFLVPSARQLWLSLAATFCGLLLSGRPWAVELLVLNLETGAGEEAPAHVWDEAGSGWGVGGCFGLQALGCCWPL
jgi:hypothetical protein